MVVRAFCINCRSWRRRDIRITDNGYRKMTDLPLDPPDETYECPFCQKQCGGPNSYRQHVLSCHLNEYLEPEPDMEDV